jgi:nucleoside-diphosphate-sugar epimerase
MSRRGILRKGDSITQNLNNVVAVKGDCITPPSYLIPYHKEDTYPEELSNIQSIIHTVGCLFPGKKPGTSYKEMNLDSAVNLARKFNELAKEQEVMKNFIFISSEKAPPFLNEYLTSKQEAEEYLLNECDNLRVHVLRPGFIVQPGDRSWSPFVG